MSEEIFLEMVSRYFPVEHTGLVVGRGDDCAVLTSSVALCVSSDLFLEGVHFKRTYFSPQDIGYKSLAVNLSDIAAMGANPLGFILSLMIPDNTDPPFWEGFFQGISGLAQEYELFLAGGDLSQAPFLGIDLTIMGQSSVKPLCRQRVGPGDYLFVLGRDPAVIGGDFLELGLARVGLKVLEEGQKRDYYPQSIRQHLRPQVFVHEGQLLARTPGVKGAMDVSDGLAQDLPRFLGPGLGAELIITEDIIHPEVLSFAHEHDGSPFDLVFLGGEDYLLLGGVCADKARELEEEIPGLRVIGEVTSKPGIVVNGQSRDLLGFDHLAHWR